MHEQDPRGLAGQAVSTGRDIADIGLLVRPGAPANAPTYLYRNVYTPAGDVRRTVVRLDPWVDLPGTSTLDWPG
ncbi:hypothetical protein OG689_41935 [Kitasatospora sp. NBC_00240]|uniref:hypothetical protein n=1 Tax=Kitasatospora sp. NBC_00240 TaxID=2903567 RepID=UPI0022589293|nr:hypothetical protein [Kitasatospora sp. NBC_00240]MCX5215720.1 hypothetical protein [Kitasatospora sp. NBC_00240]